VAVGIGKLTLAPAPLVASTAAGAAYAEKTGGIVSTTVTVNDALDELPNGSVAVHVTVVAHGDAPVPPPAAGQVREKVVLGGGEHVTVTPGGTAPHV
jgi:uncharacterized protein (DUF111 family)